MGLKQVGSDAGDHAAGHQALGDDAEFVAGAGDHAAFARGESGEAGAGDFFGGFAVLGGEAQVILSGDFVEFRFCRPGAERADADAMGAHFLGEAFGEEQIESFGGGVNGDVGNGLKGCGGGEDEDIAALAREHLGKVEARQVHDGAAIYLDHIEQALGIDARNFAVLAKACVVDEQMDGERALLGEGEDLLRGVWLGEICGEDFGQDVVFGAKVAR